MKRMEASPVVDAVPLQTRSPHLHQLYGKKFEERYLACERLGRGGQRSRARRSRALELWKKMLSMLFETGHPWITFKDARNLRSPQDHVSGVDPPSRPTSAPRSPSTPPTTRPPCATSARLHPSRRISLPATARSRPQKPPRDHSPRRPRASTTSSTSTSTRRSPPRPRTSATVPSALGVMGLATRALPEGRRLRLARGRRVQRRGHDGGHRPLRPRGQLGPRLAERATYSSYQGSKWSRGLPHPAGHHRPSSSRRRGVPTSKCRAAAAWTGPPCARKNRQARHAQQQRPRHRANGDDLEHHSDLAPCIEPTYQEPLRQIQPSPASSSS